MPLDSARPVLPAAELRTSLVDDLTALDLPAALLTAKAYEIFVLLRDAVASRLYLGEILDYRTDGDRERAETVVRAIDRATAVARERRLRRTESLASRENVAYTLGLRPLVRTIERLDAAAEFDLQRAHLEVAQLIGLLAPATAPHEAPPSAPYRRPEFPPLPPTSRRVRRGAEEVVSARQVTASIEQAADELSSELASVVRYEEELKRRLEEVTTTATATDERHDEAAHDQQEYIDRTRHRLHELKDEADGLAARLSRSFASRTRAARLTLLCAEHRHVVLGTALETALSSAAEIMPGVLRSPERRADFTEVFARSLMLAAGISPDDTVTLTPPPPDLPAQVGALAAPDADCASRQTRALIACLAEDGPERRVAALCLSADPRFAPLRAALHTASARR